MIYCKSYDEARLAIIHSLSDTTEQFWCNYEIKYDPNDRNYPFKVDQWCFSTEEFNKMCEMGD